MRVDYLSPEVIHVATQLRHGMAKRSAATRRPSVETRPVLFLQNGEAETQSEVIKISRPDTRRLVSHYHPPALHEGDPALCLFRDTGVGITSCTDARISRPQL